MKKTSDEDEKVKKCCFKCFKRYFVLMKLGESYCDENKKIIAQIPDDSLLIKQGLASFVMSNTTLADEGQAFKPLKKNDKDQSKRSGSQKSSESSSSQTSSDESASRNSRLTRIMSNRSEIRSRRRSTISIRSRRSISYVCYAHGRIDSFGRPVQASVPARRGSIVLSVSGGSRNSRISRPIVRS